MRIEQSFAVSRPPEIVFDYLINPANLAAWQTSKTSRRAAHRRRPAAGHTVRERTKGPRGKEFEQIVEFTEFDRPRVSTRTSSRGHIPSTARGRSQPTAPGRE